MATIGKASSGCSHSRAGPAAHGLLALAPRRAHRQPASPRGCPHMSHLGPPISSFAYVQCLQQGMMGETAGLAGRSGSARSIGGPLRRSLQTDGWRLSWKASSATRSPHASGSQGCDRPALPESGLLLEHHLLHISHAALPPLAGARDAPAAGGGRLALGGRRLCRRRLRHRRLRRRDAGPRLVYGNCRAGRAGRQAGLTWRKTQAGSRRGPPAEQTDGATALLPAPDHHHHHHYHHQHPVQPPVMHHVLAPRSGPPAHRRTP